MSKVPQSVLLGFPSFIAFMIGAELFETRGANSMKEILAGSLTLALYQAICQFFLMRKGTFGLRACWPTMAGMNAALLFVFLLIVVANEPGVVWSQGVPMLLSGCIGTFIGAVLATWKTTHAGDHSAQG
jgi:hypothetical protein